MAESNLEKLPLEVAFQILLDLEYPDLIRTCHVNRFFWSICQDDYFWQIKTELDYPNHPERTSFPLWTWRQLYDHLRQGHLRQIPLYYYPRGNDPFDLVWVYQGYTHGQLLQICQEHFDEAYPNELPPNFTIRLIIVVGNADQFVTMNVMDFNDPIPVGEVEGIWKLVLSQQRRIPCPACQSLDIILMERPIRSADEVATLIGRCQRCRHRWRH
jgi:hypothetical protein